MLPRVGAALSLFLKPVSTTQQKNQADKKSDPNASQNRQRGSSQDRSGDNPQEGFQKFTPPSEAKLKLVKNDESEGHPPHPSSTPSSSEGMPSVASSFLLIFKLLEKKRETLIRWLGRGTYLSAARKKKGASQLKKGTMLDQKAE